MKNFKKVEDCSREELIERLRRLQDRLSSVREQVSALEKRVVSERSGRRKANRERDEVVSKLKAIKKIVFGIGDTDE